MPHRAIESMHEGFATLRVIRERGGIVDFEWTYINPAGAATYRRRPEALVGQRVSAILPGFLGSESFARMCEVIATGREVAVTSSVYSDQALTGVFDTRAWSHGDDGVAVTWRDVTAMAEATRALAISEERFRTTVEHLPDAVSVFSSIRDERGAIIDFRWISANPAATALTGYSAESLVGRRLLEVLPGHAGGQLAIYRRVVETGEPYIEPTLWYADVWGDGQNRRRAFDVRATKLHDGFVVVAREVTELREKSEELESHARALHRANVEKDLLLKEIHHRVKNNLQLVSSLLSLQARSVRDPEAVEQLRQSEARVRSISLVHEQLYGAKELSALRSDSYVLALARGIEAALGGGSGRSVELATEIEPMAIDVDTAVPLGVLVGELLTNAFKHAFVGRTSGRIAVKLAREGDMVELAVSDDGIGLPADLESRRQRSFGMELIHMLAEQLDGTLAIASPPTRFTVRFPGRSRTAGC